MIITIEPDSSIPLYLQLRGRIVEGILRGELPPGNPLPSVRQMAVDLGINLHTVNRAYDLLRTEGFIRMSGRKGAWIAPAPPRYDGAFLEELGWQMRNLYREALSRGVERGVFESLLQRIIAEEPGAVSN